MPEKNYETSFVANGRKVTLTLDRAPFRMVDMVSSTGVIQPVRIDNHDELREDEYRILRPMPDGSSPLVQDHITDDPAHPTLPVSVWDKAGNRQWDGKNKPQIKHVHVDPKFVAMVDSLRDQQLAKERSQASAMPQNKAREDLVIAAAQAMANAAEKQADAAKAQAEVARSQRAPKAQ